MTMSMIELTNTTPGHFKFWAVKREGKSVTCYWGRIGNRAQSKVFDFSVEGAARHFVTRKLNEKLGRGYIVKSRVVF